MARHVLARNNASEWPLAFAVGPSDAYSAPSAHVPMSWFFLQKIRGHQNVEKPGTQWSAPSGIADTSAG